MNLEQLVHDAVGPAAGEGTHDRHGQDLRRHADQLRQGRQQLREIPHGPGGAEHADRDQHRHEEGDDADARVEPLLGALRKGLVDLNLFNDAIGADNQDNDGNGVQRDRIDDIDEHVLPPYSASAAGFENASSKILSGLLTRKRRIRDIVLAAITATIVETRVAMIVGPMISTALEDPAATR